MTKLLRRVFVVLMFRIDWKKLLLVSSFLTVASIFVQISRLPYPLNEWIFSPSTVVTYKPLYNAITENSPITLVNRLKVVQLATTSVSPNSSAKLNHSKFGVEGENLSSIRRRRKKRSQRKHVKEINMMTTPLSPPFYVNMSKDLLKNIWSMQPNEALVYARTEIENAPVFRDDPDLYAPLFRNVSTFKRSYEMMELILKVYIYKEGKRPVFHQPHLQGIYSSEGWFMKLMEENRRFTTTDAEKAHLFYLPYGARQLQKALYVPNSHNIRSLSLFLRDHVNMLAAKYPFWNRSHRSDHFLVACHDWGPYTLNEHEELRRNTIKALCNADASEKIFIQGKDVSLPETTIRNPRRPLRNLGGKRVSQRPILAFFAGNMHGRVRPRLLKYWGYKDDDMRIYGPLPNRVSKIMSYT